jgi:hypothetical protein
MFDNGKLSLWDVFNNLSIGLATLLIILFSVFFYVDFDHFKILELLSKFSPVLIIIMPVLLLLLGMLVDALSNRFHRTQIKIFRINKRVSRDQMEVEAKVRKLLPDIITEKTMFRYCKAFVSQNCKNNNVEVFLARFGFYRNFSFILFMSSFVSYYAFCSMMFSIIIFFLSRVFMSRSSHFLSLLESEVYYNYLASNIKKDF